MVVRKTPLVKGFMGSGMVTRGNVLGGAVQWGRPFLGFNRMGSGFIANHSFKDETHECRPIDTFREI